MAGMKGKTAGNKNSTQKVRMLDNKKVVSCLYVGNREGVGKYMAAMIDDKLVIDEKSGLPYKFREVGKLV